MLEHFANHDGAFNTGIFCNLPNRSLQSTACMMAMPASWSAIVTFDVLSTLAEQCKKCDAATWDDAFFNSGAC